VVYYNWVVVKNFYLCYIKIRRPHISEVLFGSEPDAKPLPHCGRLISCGNLANMNVAECRGASGLPFLLSKNKKAGRTNIILPAFSVDKTLWQLEGRGPRVLYPPSAAFVISEDRGNVNIH
jgi:hypothetical protein